MNEEPAACAPVVVVVGRAEQYAEHRLAAWEQRMLTLPEITHGQWLRAVAASYRVGFAAGVTEAAASSGTTPLDQERPGPTLMDRAELYAFSNAVDLTCEVPAVKLPGGPSNSDEAKLLLLHELAKLLTGGWLNGYAQGQSEPIAGPGLGPEPPVGSVAFVCARCRIKAPRGPGVNAEQLQKRGWTSVPQTAGKRFWVCPACQPASP